MLANANIQPALTKLADMPSSLTYYVTRVAIEHAGPRPLPFGALSQEVVRCSCRGRPRLLLTESGLYHAGQERVCSAESGRNLADLVESRHRQADDMAFESVERVLR
jgi:hypothetical protein